MRSIGIFTCATVVATALFATTVLADPNSDTLISKFNLQNAVNIALFIREHAIQRDLTQKLAFYHALSPGEVNSMTDLQALRAQVLAAQDAARISSETVATILTPDATTQLLNQLSPALVPAIRTDRLASPVAVNLGGTRWMMIYDETTGGGAPAVSPATETTCSVFQYVTGIYGTAGPSSLTTTASTGQKNFLAGVGFVLGLVPVVMHCSKDHSTQQKAGGTQTPPSS